MLRFVGSRGLQMVVTLWVAVTLLFVVVTVLPGDPVRALFGFQPAPPEVYDAIVRDYHLVVRGIQVLCEQRAQTPLQQRATDHGL